jgi:hypothetical protein
VLELKQLLVSQGCAVTASAHDPTQALALIADERPDAVIMDLNLDGQSARWRRRSRRTRFRSSSSAHLRLQPDLNKPVDHPGVDARPAAPQGLILTSFTHLVADAHGRSCRVGPGNFTPSRSQIPDLILSHHPARAIARRLRRALLHLQYSYASPFGPAILVTQGTLSPFAAPR